jgi:phage terminase large subunit-like protein
MHLTGLYPEWWTGKRFHKPTNWLAGSESSELTKKGIQRLLFGRDLNDVGTGLIPKNCIESFAPARGIPEMIDSAKIKNINGGFSTIALKSYEQGRSKWQADTVDGIWFDEEPPLEVYTEGLTRTNTTLGPILLTLTPLMGNTQVIARFLGDEPVSNTHVITMTIDDALHYSDDQRKAIIDSYPAHEREARTKGIPMRGSGAVFPITEASITCEPFKIPDHWPQINGLDFGIGHPTGAANLAWDRDSDVVYVTKVYREKDVTPPLYAPAINAWGTWIPIAWPHDGLQRDKGSGEQLAEICKRLGMKMLPQRATFEDGTHGFEAGIMLMMTRMQTGRFKVFSTCNKFFEEFRMYHRKDGLVVKILDDVLSAVRTAMMELREAKTKPMPKQYNPYDLPHNAQGWMGR